MKKGQHRREWNPEMKSLIVHRYLDEHISVRELEKEYQADRSMICRWVKKYIAEGEASFYHKGHPGNPYAALNTSKNLSELERLRLTVAKLEIENERLKKGYQVKGAGASREYVIGCGRNTKLLKSSK